MPDLERYYQNRLNFPLKVLNIKPCSIGWILGTLFDEERKIEREDFEIW